MTKSNKRIILPIVLILVIIGLLIGSAFWGIFLFQRYSPQTRYAKAEVKWLNASQKQAHDDFAIEIVLGNDNNNITVVFEINGTRNYNCDNYNFDYIIKVIAKDLPNIPISMVPVLILHLQLASDGNENHLTLSKESGMIDFQTIESSFTKQEVGSLDIFSQNLSLYDDENILIDKNGKYSINGDDSLDFLIESMNLIISNYVDIDLTQMEFNTSRIRGDIKYKTGFTISSMTSRYSVSFFPPWEHIIDEISEMDLPSNIMGMIKNKKIFVEDLDYELDLNEILRDDSPINVRIVGDTSYKIIKR